MAKILSIDDRDVIDWYFEISSTCNNSFFLVVLPYTKKTYLFELGKRKNKEFVGGHFSPAFKIK